MPRAPADLTPVQAFLAPLARHAARLADADALVFWHGADGWPDDPTEELEAEEVAFYAEGLLDEGFHLDWRLMATADAPTRPDHLQLFLWEDPAPEPPEAEGGWQVLDRGHWTGPPA
jgi:hypothetical protein